MKPLGSITIDFPFLDESTRDLISSVMSDSNDYWDFSNRLAEEACRPDANQLLVFLALHHAERLENFKAIEKIGSCHHSAPLVRPFLISGTEPFVNIAESIESAVDSCNNDAIRFHLLMKLFFHADTGDPDELNLQRMLEDLLDRNSLLEGHRPLYYKRLGYHLKIQGDPDTGLEYILKGIELAREFDDKWNQVALLLLLAEEHLDKAKELALKGGLEMTLGAWYGAAAGFEEMRGDLDSAMDYLIRSLEIVERAKRYVRLRGGIHALAKLELKQYNPTKQKTEDEYSGPWMARYAEIINEGNLTGHELHLKLMKAELRLKQGKQIEAAEYLNDVIRNANHNSRRHFHQRALELKKNWIAEQLVPAAYFQP